MVTQHAEHHSDMARRALLTDAEREALEDPDSRDNPYVAVSRVRRKINEELPRDVQILRENRPDLYEELRKAICEDVGHGFAETEYADEAEQVLRDLGLPGRGDDLEARIEALLEMHDHLRRYEGERVSTSQMKEIARKHDHGYANADSFWTNCVKKNAAQDRPNALKALPGVEEVGSGEYTYKEGDD